MFVFTNCGVLGVFSGKLPFFPFSLFFKYLSHNVGNFFCGIGFIDIVYL